MMPSCWACSRDHENAVPALSVSNLSLAVRVLDQLLDEREEMTRAEGPRSRL